MFGSYDITFCDNKKCKKRKTCERRTERLEKYHYPVSMSHFEPDKNGNCNEYLKKEEHKSKTAQEKADMLFVEYLMDNKRMKFEDWIKNKYKRIPTTNTLTEN